MAELGRTGNWRQVVANLESREYLLQFLQQLAAEIPWGHHRLLLEKNLTPRAGLDYLRTDIEVEYSLKSKSNPIGVAEYQLQSRLPPEFTGKLPPALQLETTVRTL